MNMDLNLSPSNRGPAMNHQEVCDMVTLIQTSFKPRQKMKKTNFFESQDRLHYSDYVALDPHYNKMQRQKRKLDRIREKMSKTMLSEQKNQEKRAVFLTHNLNQQSQEQSQMMLPDIPKHQIKTETIDSGNPWLNMKSIDVGLKTQEDELNTGNRLVENPHEVTFEKQKKNRNHRSHMGRSLDFTREKHNRNLAQSQQFITNQVKESKLHRNSQNKSYISGFKNNHDNNKLNQLYWHMKNKEKKQEPSTAVLQPINHYAQNLSTVASRMPYVTDEVQWKIQNQTRYSNWEKEKLKLHFDMSKPINISQVKTPQVHPTGSRDSVRTNDTKIMVQMNISRAKGFFDQGQVDEIIIGDSYDKNDGKKQVLKKYDNSNLTTPGRNSIVLENSLPKNNIETSFQINKLNLNIQDLKSKYNDVTETPRKSQNEVIINKMLSNRLSINTDLYQEHLSQGQQSAMKAKEGKDLKDLSNPSSVEIQLKPYLKKSTKANQQKQAKLLNLSLEGSTVELQTKSQQNSKEELPMKQAQFQEIIPISLSPIRKNNFPNVQKQFSNKHFQVKNMKNSPRGSVFHEQFISHDSRISMASPMDQWHTTRNENVNLNNKAPTVLNVVNKSPDSNDRHINEYNSLTEVDIDNMNNDLPLTKAGERQNKLQNKSPDSSKIKGLFGSPVVFNSSNDKINRFNRNQKQSKKDMLNTRERLDILIPNERGQGIKIAKVDTMEMTNDGKTKDMDSSVDFGPIELDQEQELSKYETIQLKGQNTLNSNSYDTFEQGSPAFLHSMLFPADKQNAETQKTPMGGDSKKKLLNKTATSNFNFQQIKNNNKTYTKSTRQAYSLKGKKDLQINFEIQRLMQTSYFPASTTYKKPRKQSPLPFENQRDSLLKGSYQKSTMDPGPINVVNGPMTLTQPTFNTTQYSSFDTDNQQDWQVINQKTFGNYLQFKNQLSENSTLNNTTRTIHEVKFPKVRKDSDMTLNNPLYKYKHIQNGSRNPSASVSNKVISETNAENKPDTTESLHEFSKQDQEEEAQLPPSEKNILIEESNDISSPQLQMLPTGHDTLFRNTQRNNSRESNSASKTGEYNLSKNQRTSPLSMQKPEISHKSNDNPDLEIQKEGLTPQSPREGVGLIHITEQDQIYKNDIINEEDCISQEQMDIKVHPMSVNKFQISQKRGKSIKNRNIVDTLPVEQYWQAEPTGSIKSMYQTQVLSKMIHNNLLARASPDEKPKILDQAKRENYEASKQGRDSYMSNRSSPLGIVTRRLNQQAAVSGSPHDPHKSVNKQLRAMLNKGSPRITQPIKQGSLAGNSINYNAGEFSVIKSKKNSQRGKSIGGQSTLNQKHIVVINNHSRQDGDESEKKLERDETLQEMKKIHEIADENINIISQPQSTREVKRKSTISLNININNNQICQNPNQQSKLSIFNTKTSFVQHHQTPYNNELNKSFNNMDLIGIKEKSQKLTNNDKVIKRNKKGKISAAKLQEPEGETVFKNTEKVGGWNYGNKSYSKDSRVDSMISQKT